MKTNNTLIWFFFALVLIACVAGSKETSSRRLNSGRLGEKDTTREYRQYEVHLEEEVIDTGIGDRSDWIKAFDSLRQDSLDAICAERGHVSDGVCSRTLEYCMPYTIDYEDSTVRVYPACNTTTCTCVRCGREYSYEGSEVRETIWRKGSE